jgi:Lysophospholipase L1 and related esterases
MQFQIPVSCKVVVCGDSISAGVIYDEREQKYVRSKETLVCMMQNRLNCAITNLSRFGNTIGAALPRLKKDLTKENVDVVVFELGGNDCDYKWDQIALHPEAEHLPATDLTVFENALKQIASVLKQKGILPVFTTLPPLDPDRYFNWVSKNSGEAGARILSWLGSVSRIYWWHERYNSAVIRSAVSTGAALFDLRSVFLETADFRKYLCGDGIHPNKAGHRLMSESILRYLGGKYPALLKPAGSCI